MALRTSCEQQQPPSLQLQAEAESSPPALRAQQRPGVPQGFKLQGDDLSDRPPCPRARSVQQAAAAVQTQDMGG